MNRVIARLRRLPRWLSDRWGYFGARLLGLRVPVFPLAYLPDGFTVQPAGATGLTLVENFCTAAEAADLIALARNQLQESRITIDGAQVTDAYRRSHTAVVYDQFVQNREALPLLYRAGMLLGLPPENAETVFVTRYQAGDYYKVHEDYAAGFDGDRLYTVLIYLNDLQPAQGGATVFEQLNIAVQPRCGRAVIWTNTNPDGSRHPETRHEALPVTSGEKWAIQLWFRRYPLLHRPAAPDPAPQAVPGKPPEDAAALPAGVAVVAQVVPGSDHDKAFS
jgi:prolyl 4-hydroxylase